MKSRKPVFLLTFAPCPGFTWWILQAVNGSKGALMQAGLAHKPCAPELYCNSVSTELQTPARSQTQLLRTHGPRRRSMSTEFSPRGLQWVWCVTRCQRRSSSSGRSEGGHCVKLLTRWRPCSETLSEVIFGF